MKDERILTMRNYHLMEDYDRPKTAAQDIIWPNDQFYNRNILPTADSSVHSLSSNHALFASKASQHVKTAASHISSKIGDNLTRQKSFQDVVQSKSFLEQTKADAKQFLMVLINWYGHMISKFPLPNHQLQSTKVEAQQETKFTIGFPKHYFSNEALAAIKALPEKYQDLVPKLVEHIERRGSVYYSIHLDTSSVIPILKKLDELPLGLFKECKRSDYTEDFFFTVATIFAEAGIAHLGYAPIASIIFRRAYLGWHGINPGFNFRQIAETISEEEKAVIDIDPQTKKKIKTNVKVQKKKSHHEKFVFCTTPKEVCLFTQFDGCFTSLGNGKHGPTPNFSLAVGAINFLIDNNFSREKYLKDPLYNDSVFQKIVEIITLIIDKIHPLYVLYLNQDLKFDVAQGAVLYYSPHSMIPKGRPPTNWDFSMLEEVFPHGFPDNINTTKKYTSFRFFKYNSANNWKRV